MNWYPKKRAGLLWGLGILLALAAVLYYLFRATVGRPFDTALVGRVVVLLAALALWLGLAYAWYGLANLAYRCGRNGIVIRWAGTREIVPMAEITAIEPATGEVEIEGGVIWPGYRVGVAQVDGLGEVRLYVTGVLADALLVRTAGCAYLISPARRAEFVADWRARRALGPIATWSQGRRLPTLFALPLWRDRLAGLLFVPGLLLNLGLFAATAARFPALPARIALPFDLRGLGQTVMPRALLFDLPLLALALLLLNGLLAAWVHRRERLLALLLLGEAPLVQVLAWLATARLAG
jgi:hypothetical protein